MCIQAKKTKQTSFNVFIFIFQINGWAKYDAIGSNNLCVPIPLTNELGKTTKDHKCWKLQFN